MFDAIKPLLDGGIINEDTSRAITEAWVSKLNEAREEIRAELREEYAQKYSHDKEVMVEALDKMVSEYLSEEIREFHEERKALNEDRVRAQEQLRQTATNFNNFLVQKLAEEIRELRSERQHQMEGRKALEGFVVRALAEEIREFATDKRALVEAKVKLVAEGREKLRQLQARFIAESSRKVSHAVTTHLASEMQQLKEDIKIARENDFGRRIFESFASEYSATHLNEKVETRRLMSELAQKNAQLQEAAKKIKESQTLIESKEREVRIIKESTERQKVLSKLLGTLNKEKSAVMKDLLESVQTPKLQAAFDKYLPAVLNGSGSKPAQQAKATLTEGAIREVTGDKSAKVEVEVEGRDNVIDLKRLAGL